MKTKNLLIWIFVTLIFLSCKKSDNSSSSSDKTSPVITLKGSETIEIPFGIDTPDPGANASDETDGDLSSQVTSDWNTKVQKNVLGEYTVTYTVSDKSGNKSTKTRKVIVKLNSSSYFGNYNTSYSVIGGGTSNVSSSIVAGDNATQFTVNYYLGAGGFPFKVNIAGTLGTELSVNTVANGITLTGNGFSENGGQKFTLNLKESYATYTNNLNVVFVKQ